MAKKKKNPEEVEEKVLEVQSENTEVVADTVENLETKSVVDGLTMSISITQRTSDQKWCAEWNDGEKTYVGVDITPLDSIIDLCHMIELANTEDIVRKGQRYKEINLPHALSLAHDIVEIINDNHIGGKWFTAYELVVKTKNDLQHINKQLEWLKTYDLVENDRSGDIAGRRWRIVSSRRLQMSILEKRKKDIEQSLADVNFQIEKIAMPENVSLKAQETFDEIKK
jgi:hypothetical protein